MNPRSSHNARRAAGRRSRTPAIGLSCCMAVLLTACATAARGQSVWELTPYRIHALVTVASGPELTERLRAELPATIIGRLGSLVGAPWDLSTVEVSPQLQRVMTADINAVTREMLPKQSREVDKVLLLTIVPTVEGYRVAARELDVRTQQWGSTVSRHAYQRGKLRDVGAASLFDAFAPLARIEDVETSKRLVVLRLKAGSLPMRDAQSLVSPGDLFRGVVRYNDREGNPRRITTIPWTFCQVYQVTPTDVRCDLHTGLRSPLSSRRRGRVERYALGVIPPEKPSILTLQSRSDLQQKLAGYEIYARSPKSTNPAEQGSAQATDKKTPEKKKGDPPKAVLLGRTDRQGQMTIRPTENPLRILIVRNGNELLARLPVIPGLEPELTAVVANDDYRLEAEGIISGLQEEMVDVVVRRNVLMARVRKRIENGEFDEATEMVTSLGELPDASDFIRTMTAQKKNLRTNDRAIQAKIDALFGDTQKAIRKYLAPEPVEQLRQEFRQAKGNADAEA